MKEYRVAKGWAIFLYIMTPVMIGVSTATLVNIFLHEEVSMIVYVLVAPALLLINVISVCGMIDAVKWRLTIDDEKVTEKGLFKNREINIADIAGYRIDENYITIVSQIKGYKNIKVSKYTGDYYEVEHWLQHSFDDLDNLEAAREQQTFLERDEYGFSTEDRTEKLKRTRKVALVLNIAGTFAMVMSFFAKPPYQFLIFVPVTVAIIVLLVTRLSKGLIKIDKRKGSIYPTVLWGFSAPCLVLLLKAMFGFHVYNYTNVWLPVALIIIGLLFLLLFRNEQFSFRKRADYIAVFALLFLSGGYGYGAIVCVNALYDKSVPHVFHAKVLHKYDYRDKYMKTYYLTLSPWGNRTKDESVTVPENLYNKVEINDSVTINLMKGEFDIPWFLVKE